MKKININGKMLNVVDYEEFCKNKEIYNNDTMSAVEVNGTVYPIRTSLADERAGVVNQGCLNFFKEPEDKDNYSSNNIIDLSNNRDILDLMQKQEKVRNIEREVLTSPDNIFTPPLFPEDSPEMRGLKDAVIAKHIDLDKYADRFGSNYANDKRLLKGKSITMLMLKRFYNILDIKATMVLEDKNPNVANPMGREIVINITDDGEEDE